MNTISTQTEVLLTLNRFFPLGDPPCFLRVPEETLTRVAPKFFTLDQLFVLDPCFDNFSYNYHVCPVRCRKVSHIRTLPPS